MSEPLFLKPVFQERIWGGKRLKSEFGFDLPNQKIGECWAISAHPNGVSIVENGRFKGKSLAELWQNHKELFGNSQADTFPLLTKILDAEDDLSVQVHPDDAYGLSHAGELGKTECWYIIDAQPGAEIIYGHHAKSQDELTQMIADKQWDKLLQKVPVKKGDFFYVPSGTIHAIGKGILILETQQSSDTTYRVYDYDRKDQQGNTRELHQKESIEVTTIPSQTPDVAITQQKQGNSLIKHYVKTRFFNVDQWQVKGKLSFEQQAPYTLATVIDGSGALIIGSSEETQRKSYPLTKGCSFILPTAIRQWEIEGDVTLIASEPGTDVAI